MAVKNVRSEQPGLEKIGLTLIIYLKNSYAEGKGSVSILSVGKRGIREVMSIIRCWPVFRQLFGT